MPIFIDRRLNPKDKSLGNRQRFLRRAREELKRSIRDKVQAGGINLNHAEMLKVATQVKSGRIAWNHNESLRD